MKAGLNAAVAGDGNKRVLSCTNMVADVDFSREGS